MQSEPERFRRSAQGAGQRRPQYPDEAPSSGAQNSPAYPGQNYGPQGGYGTYRAPEQGNYGYRDYRSDMPEPRGRRSGGDKERRSHDKKGHPIVWLLVCIVCIVLLLVGWLNVQALSTVYTPAFNQKMTYLAGNTFYNGVHVDGIHIGGMTYDEAHAVLSQNAAYSNQFFSLAVTIDGMTWHITQNELPLERNIDAMLEEAMSIGRQSDSATVYSGLTPFEQRYQQMWAANQNGAYLNTSITYDKATLRSLCETLSSRVGTHPEDAMIYSFDFKTRSFTFQSEKLGTALSAEEIYNAVAPQLDAHNYNASVSLQTHPIEPAVTVASLQSSYGLIGTYTTSTEGLTGYNRTKNIELACAAISGTVVRSGETFSFNNATGMRTVDKGYLPAGAIAQGASIEEVGGGVCQVSSTLFNAVALAGMEIVYSSPHAWPSSYVEPGRDATVDWQYGQTLAKSLDFKFRNNSNFPLYIVAYLDSSSNYNKTRKVTVEVYGASLGQGVTVKLITDCYEYTPAPAEPKLTYDPTMEYGTETVVVKARDGYKYHTYRVYYYNGTETKRELLRNSTYRVYQQEIKYNGTR